MTKKLYTDDDLWNAVMQKRKLLAVFLAVFGVWLVAVVVRDASIRGSDAALGHCYHLCNYGDFSDVYIPLYGNQL